MAELAGEAAVGQLADLPGQLDAGRPATDDDEGHPEPLERGVARRLGDLESPVDPAPELHGVVDRLHPRRDQRELVMAEVGLAGAGGDDEAVVGVLTDLAGDTGGVDDPALQVEPGHSARTTFTFLLRRMCRRTGEIEPGDRMPVATW